MKTSILQHLLKTARRTGWNRTSPEEALGPALRVPRSAIAGLLVFALTWSLVLPFRTQAAATPVAKPNTPVTTEPSSLTQTTETFNVYGPQRFTRLTGQAVNAVQSFSLP